MTHVFCRSEAIHTRPAIRLLKGDLQVHDQIVEQMFNGHGLDRSGKAA